MLQRVSKPFVPMAIRQRILAAADEVAEMAATQHVALLRALSPVGDRSDPLNAGKGPHLRDSWAIVPEGPGRRKVVALPQWRWAMESGARPHTIRPRRAKLLRFRGRDGRIVFARVVKHPGYPPQRIVTKTAQDVIADVQATTRATLGAVLRRAP